MAATIDRMKGIELRCRREALGLSQYELGDAIGVKQVTVSAWENGTRGIPDGIAGELASLEEGVERRVDALLESDVDVITLSRDASMLERVTAARFLVAARDDGRTVEIVKGLDDVPRHAAVSARHLSDGLFPRQPCSDDG